MRAHTHARTTKPHAHGRCASPPILFCCCCCCVARQVMTPLVFSQRLWQTSGHWDHYREDMFQVKVWEAHEVMLRLAVQPPSRTSISLASCFVCVCVCVCVCARVCVPVHCSPKGFGDADVGNDEPQQQQQQQQQQSANLKGLKPMNCPAHCLIFDHTKVGRLFQTRIHAHTHTHTTHRHTHVLRFVPLAANAPRPSPSPL